MTKNIPTRTPRIVDVDHTYSGERDEKGPVLEALYDGHKNLRQISGAIRDAAFAFRELTDAVTVLLIYIEGGQGAFHRKGFLKAVDKVRDALDKVVP